MACMPGLCTAAHLLYQMIDFNILHVSLSILLFVCLVVVKVLVVDWCWRLPELRHNADIPCCVHRATLLPLQVLDLGETRTLVHSHQATPVHVRRRQTAGRQSGSHKARGI